MFIPRSARAREAAAGIMPSRPLTLVVDRIYNFVSPA